MTQIGNKMSPENYERMKYIVNDRESGLTLKNIAEKYNLCQGRISQILYQAELLLKFNKISIL